VSYDPAMRTLGFAVAAGALIFLGAPGAIANGRFPAANQIAFSPSDPNFVLLRTTFGILLSHDSGVTWHWLCEDVFGAASSSTADPVLAITAGSIMASSLLNRGLMVSPDSGCAWSMAGGPLYGEFIKDLVGRPGAPGTVLALTSTYASNAGLDGGPGYSQQVYESVDDGVSWSPLGAPIDPNSLTTTIELAASDAARIYVSVVRGADATRTASLFVSSDDGASWTERPVPIDPNNESQIFIGAVDPMNADRVYVRTLGHPSRLLVTSDAGKSYQAALSLSGAMLGFALLADGSKVFGGSVEDGLFEATRDELAFRNVSMIHVQCLSAHGTDLWACSDEPSGFIAGVSSDDGHTFAARAHLRGQPAIACAAGSTAAQCSMAPWQAFCAQLPECPDGGGAMDASDAGATLKPKARTHGCSATDGGGGAAGMFAAGVLAAIAAWSRRRRAPAPRDAR
jgi:MYXO-CTERM domain-containing protein